MAILSENAEYHAARERQSFIEGRVIELEEIVSAAEVIDPSDAVGRPDQVRRPLKLVDEETEKETAYQIVGVHEADIKAQRLSISSPLAKALIGKKAGDTISVPAPGGDRTYEVLVSSLTGSADHARGRARAAAGRIAGRVLRTPSIPSHAVCQATGAEVTLKLENLQQIGSFKERGAANKLALLSPEERARGVIAMSAGNHAQAVARHASLLGVRATIVMPQFTPRPR